MSRLTLRPDQPFDLNNTLSCGQVFRWDHCDGWWQGMVEDKAIRVRQEDTTLFIEGVTRAFARRYFALDEDLTAILSSIDRDTRIHEAITACYGLRIVRQPPWECTLSYLIATFSNIPTIRRRIETLARGLGKKITTKGGTYYGFPGPEAFSSSCTSTINSCRLGYRGPYLQDTVCRLASDPGWDERIRSLPYENARKDLTRLRGIGPKAADCILLFAFQKYESFPVDVWIRRIMQESYPALQGKGNEAIRRFGQEYFGTYAGYAQEYLYAARQVPTSHAFR
ncbi:MAG: 8-oxoguanine DNA glycosylase [Methanomicrobiales archaeon]|nr:8-oxoguanine DNA glycosylase [Methanomicrobiales archaeon]